MGAYAEEGGHPSFAKKTLTEEQILGFRSNDRLASQFMYHLDTLPPSRELSLAKTKFEECVFWANKSILTKADFVSKA